MLSSTAIEEVSHHEAKNDDAQLQSVVSSVCRHLQRFAGTRGVRDRFEAISKLPT